MNFHPNLNYVREACTTTLILNLNCGKVAYKWIRNFQILSLNYETAAYR
jgi:hypothetical protein